MTCCNPLISNGLESKIPPISGLAAVFGSNLQAKATVIRCVALPSATPSCRLGVGISICVQYAPSGHNYLQTWGKIFSGCIQLIAGWLVGARGAGTMARPLDTEIQRGPSLRDCGSPGFFFPTLKRGANLLCAYGARATDLGAPRRFHQKSRKHRPYGTAVHLDPFFPTLKRGANLLCAYGAWATDLGAPRRFNQKSRKQRPYGTAVHLGSFFPTLKRGANLLCAYGAWARRSGG